MVEVTTVEVAIWDEMMKPKRPDLTLHTALV